VDPARARAEMDLAAAQQLEGEIGDELLLQVFHRDEDAESARSMSSQYSALPRFDDLAPGLSLAGRPEWMRELWPHRRLLWRWGLPPPPLPSFADALDALEGWIRSVAPEVASGAGTPAVHLDPLRAFGPVTEEVIAFYERLGPRDEASQPLVVFGCQLDLPAHALDRRKMMTELAAGGHLGDGEQAWGAGWLPLIGDPALGEAHCLDLEGTPGGRKGQIVTWWRDDVQRTIQAPSFGAWVALLARAVELELLQWRPSLGIHRRADHPEWFDELHRSVLPGYPVRIVAQLPPGEGIE
jgi:hypothetical protein